MADDSDLAWIAGILLFVIPLPIPVPRSEVANRRDVATDLKLEFLARGGTREHHDRSWIEGTKEGTA
jgi:hypothetical protein